MFLLYVGIEKRRRWKSVIGERTHDDIHCVFGGNFYREPTMKERCGYSRMESGFFYVYWYDVRMKLDIKVYKEEVIIEMFYHGNVSVE